MHSSSYFYFGYTKLKFKKRTQICLKHNEANAIDIEKLEFQHWSTARKLLPREMFHQMNQKYHILAWCCCRSDLQCAQLLLLHDSIFLLPWLLTNRLCYIYSAFVCFSVNAFFTERVNDYTMFWVHNKRRLFSKWGWKRNISFWILMHEQQRQKKKTDTKRRNNWHEINRLVIVITAMAAAITSSSSSSCAQNGVTTNAKKTSRSQNTITSVYSWSNSLI